MTQHMEWQHNQLSNSEIIEKALEDTGREGISKVIAGMRSLKFYDAPGSYKNHSSYRGGLAEHSLKVYRYAMKLKKEHPKQFGAVPDDSIAIAGLLHDICKAEVYYMKPDGTPGKSLSRFPFGHGEKSVIMLLHLGLEMTENEMLAIRWHMGPCTFKEKSVDKENYDAARRSSARSLIDLIRKADGIAAHEKNESSSK